VKLQAFAMLGDYICVSYQLPAEDGQLTGKYETALFTKDGGSAALDSSGVNAWYFFLAGAEKFALTSNSNGQAYILTKNGESLVREEFDSLINSPYVPGANAVRPRFISSGKTVFAYYESVNPGKVGRLFEIKA
ncbi:MAG: hypothetical protein LBC78_04255, partial [Oscillospiraceae bacterium]|jgi:hypothetical protein|nr:hypothetical protein [Oscillospiraceae bacterium]